MAATNDEFMRMLAEEHANVDWDKVPDPDTLPDIYTIDGLKKDGKAFSIDHEYASYQEAEFKVTEVRGWADVHGPSVKIRAAKPAEAVWLWCCKEWRERVMQGEQVFPIYGP
jgi:hypothetical protein